MITLKNCVDEAYVISELFEKCSTFERFISSFNNVTGYDMTVNDLKTIIRLRAEYRHFDQLFNFG